MLRKYIEWLARSNEQKQRIEDSKKGVVVVDTTDDFHNEHNGYLFQKKKSGFFARSEGNLSLRRKPKTKSLLGNGNNNNTDQVPISWNLFNHFIFVQQQN